MKEPFPTQVVDMEFPFRLVDVGTAPGEKVAAEFERFWPSYRRWFLSAGEESRPTYADSRAALEKWMPELLADYDTFVAAVGGGDLEARFLSHWCPPPLVAACSIAMIQWPAPFLIRNYDYPPSLCTMLSLRTHWSGRSVLGMSDCGWGLMDGINDAGVAMAITFGGRREVGEGFGIGLVLRYLLQLSGSVDEAVARIQGIPVQMSYNIAMTDPSGDARIVRVAPDRPVSVIHELSCANRQGTTDWPLHAEYSNTVEREAELTALVRAPGIDIATLSAAFLHPPLFRSLADSTWGTVYTASYSPLTGDLTLLWADDHWPMNVHAADEGYRPRQAAVLMPEPIFLESSVTEPVHVPLVM